MKTISAIFFILIYVLFCSSIAGVIPVSERGNYNCACSYTIGTNCDDTDNNAPISKVHVVYKQAAKGGNYKSIYPCKLSSYVPVDSPYFLSSEAEPTVAIFFTSDHSLFIRHCALLI